MKKKNLRRVAWVLVLSSLCMLFGCQVTKESESKVSPSSQKTISEMVMAPERMALSVNNSSGNPEIKFEINAEIIIPDSVGMDVVSFEVDTIEAEEISKITEQIMPVGFDFADEKFIEECIAATEELKEVWNENEIVELEYYDILLQLLKSEEDPNVPGFRHTQVKSEGGTELSLYAAIIKGGFNTGIIFVVNNQLHMSKLGTYVAKDLIYYTVLPTLLLNLKISTEMEGRCVNLEISKEDASYLTEVEEKAMMTQELLVDLNYDGYQRISYLPKTYYKGSDGKSYWIQYSKMYNDIFILGSGNGKYSVCNYTSTMWNRNELWDLSMAPTITLGDTLSESVDLLPFSRIEEIVCNYVESEAFEPLSGISKIGSIRLEYCTLFDDNGEKGAIVPAWNFYYTESTMDENGELAYKENYSWLSINAIDGNIID